MKHQGLVLLMVALAACGAAPGPSGPVVPAAVTALIQDMQNQPVRNPPAFVARYDYAGKVVYYVPPHCCDFFGDLYDSAGILICHPGGGIAGHGDGRCPDFLSQRQNEEIIWRDSRNAG
jgi:hypothetical protein